MLWLIGVYVLRPLIHHEKPIWQQLQFQIYLGKSLQAFFKYLAEFILPSILMSPCPYRWKSPI